MEYLSITDESIKKAAEIIRAGGIAAFPTETVYGLGADAFNANALAKIFEAKGRPRFDPLIIHIANIDSLNEVADLSKLNEKAKLRLSALTEKFWPGPLSIILPKNEKIPGIATSGLPTAAIRFPVNDTAQKLIALSGGAIAAPSANPFGGLSPTTAQHVKDGLGNKVDIILDGGACSVGVESTVLDITGEQVSLLRHGGVPKEDIEKAINEKLTVNNEQKTEGFASPGMLKSHYAPRTPLKIFYHEPHELQEQENIAWLFFDSASRDKYISNNPKLLTAHCSLLTETGNLQEAAARLFDTLHEMDKLGAKRIYAQLAPNEGLGAAINDKLQRASFNLTHDKKIYLQNK